MIEIVAHTEATTLRYRAIVKFPIELALKVNSVTLVRKAAMPVLMTALAVWLQLARTVVSGEPLSCSLLWTCLPTSMPVLIDRLIASVRLVRFGNASAVFTSDTTVIISSRPSSSVR